ncbi:WD40-repeat-containing domain protein [Trametes gibbosa]|nr:WD40-repeat-containing domain protein [Trametes gibbosa]
MVLLPLHQVYSKALIGEGHGYPIWDAEPEDPAREVEVGTVGRIEDGKFWILFHAMKEAVDPYQIHGTPSTFVPFVPPDSVTSRWRKIKHSLVTPAHVSDRSIDLRANASPVGLEQLCSLGAGIKFSHKSKTGGFLYFQTPNQARKLPSKLFIVRYMREHFDSWLEFANEGLGIGLTPQEIFFVHGTQKTCRWACGAFETHSRNVEGSLNAAFTPVGSIDVAVTFSSQDAARREYNYGPTVDAPAAGTEVAPIDPASAPFNQCIFLNYFKAKKRIQVWRPRFLQAGAGPHQLPDDGDSDDSGHNDAVGAGISPASSSSDFEEIPRSGVPYDPVEYLLDYILENSGASIAIACDTDLYALFHNMEFPENIPAAINARKPPIEVDEGGAGIVIVDHSLSWNDEDEDDVDSVISVPMDSYAISSPSTPDSTSEPAAALDADLPSSSREQSQQERAGVLLRDVRPLKVEVEAVPLDVRAPGAVSEIIGPQVAFAASTPLPISASEPLIAVELTTVVPRPTNPNTPLEATLESSPPTRHDPGDLSLVSGDPTIAHVASIANPLDNNNPMDLPVEPYPRIQSSPGVTYTVPLPSSSSEKKEEDAATEKQDAIAGGDARLIREEKMTLLDVRQAASGHTGATTSLAYSHDSNTLATGSDDTSIVLWDTASQTIVRKWDAHNDIIWALAFSPDDSRLASASADGDIKVWTVASERGELLATLSGHDEAIHAMAWSPDGRWIASGSDDTTARIWDAETYEQLFALDGHEAMLLFVRFSRDSRWLVTGAADYLAHIYSVADGTRRAVLRHTGQVWSADFDADSRRVVTCSDDTTARVWSVETGEMLLRLEPHSGPIWNVWFSKDCTRILTVSSDSTMRIYDAFTGERKITMVGHTSMINSGCFSPDERYVASASSDDTVRLWQVADGSCVVTFNEHDDKATLVAFSPDGGTLASGADDGTVRIRLLNEWDPNHAEEQRRKAEEEMVADVKGKVVAL